LWARGGPKPGHNASAQDLIPRALHAVHGVQHVAEGRIEEALRGLGVEVAHELRGACEIGKEPRAQFACALQGACGRQALLGQRSRRVGKGSPDRYVDRGGGRGGSRLRVTCPDEDVAPRIDHQTLARDECMLPIV
jgi:hypothetical protein